MGNKNGKYIEMSNDKSKIKTCDVIKSAFKFIKKSNYADMCMCLDLLVERNVSPDIRTRSYKSIPFIIASLKIEPEKKCEMLRDFLSRYDINLNRSVKHCGNIMVHLPYMCDDIEYYKILLDNGAYVNSVGVNGMQLNVTVLDIILYNSLQNPKNPKNNRLKEYILSKGGQTFNSINENGCNIINSLKDEILKLEFYPLS